MGLETKDIPERTSLGQEEAQCIQETKGKPTRLQHKASEQEPRSFTRFCPYSQSGGNS